MTSHAKEIGAGPARNLATFGIPADILNKLIMNGFTNKRDIDEYPADELAKTCGLSIEEMDVINERVVKAHDIKLRFISANFMLREEAETIKTGCTDLDRIIGSPPSNGVPVGKLTELAGEGGAGKSQICMQLCVNVQLPIDQGGLDGQAAYIDTELSFRPSRIEDMAQAASEFCESIFPTKVYERKYMVRHFNDRIHHKQVRDSESLVKFITCELEKLLQEKPKVRLVIIDSIAQHFRSTHIGTAHDNYEYRKRSVDLAKISEKLKRLAFKRKLAIVLTNQVTYNPEYEINVPALGNVWQHVCSTRLIISRIDNGSEKEESIRSGRIIKAPNSAEDKTFNFKITKDGIKNCSTT